MGDLIRAGMEWLSGQVEAHASRLVTVTRGGDSVTALAAVGSCLLRVTSRMGGTRTLRTRHDYLLPASAYVLAGEQVQPAEGDLFTDSVDGKTYECLAPAEGEAHWRPCDAEGVQIRVHVKEVV